MHCLVFTFYSIQVESREQLTDMTIKILVVAIAIENENTGYGISIKYDYEKDPLKVAHTVWLNKNEHSNKTPTCVLFTKDKVFHSFGYESKQKYTELVEDMEHKEWYFFEQFLSFLTIQEVCMLSFKYTETVF